MVFVGEGCGGVGVREVAFGGEIHVENGVIEIYS